MNFYRSLLDHVKARIEDLAAAGALPAGLDLSRVAVEPPRDPSHGDVACNAAMVLARAAGQKPRDLAALLRDSLAELPQVEEVSIAGPGFLNLRFEAAFWQERLKEVLVAGRSYGESNLGAGQKVNVEYVSTNPTGPLTVGHARGAVFGDALASLLAKVGYVVTREYYINDAGAQVDTLARSTHLRYRQALGEEIGEIPEGYYPGDYLIAVGEALAARDGRIWLDQPEEQWLAPVRQFAIDALMDVIREDLARVGIKHEVFSSERGLVEAGKVETVLETLDRRGLIYTGTLQPPKGKTPEDWEPRPQTLFRATDFGDDVDRPLRKSDGSWTYFASDMAYHLDKFERGFAKMIDVWGADHGGYVKRMQAAVRALTEGQGSLDIRLCQLVRLLRGGQPVKMSKRAGTFVTLRDVVDEVGKDVVRFIMLTRKNDAALDFDLEVVVEESRDNPVFYVQYAHARIHSVLRHAAEEFKEDSLNSEVFIKSSLNLLTESGELDLIKLLAGWPRVLESAAEACEPHRLAFYMNDLAGAFHALWTKGKGDAQLRFLIREDRNLTMARLALLQAVATVIASGLEIFGVEPVEEMR